LVNAVGVYKGEKMESLIRRYRIWKMKQNTVSRPYSIGDKQVGVTQKMKTIVFGIMIIVILLSFLLSN